MTGNSQGNRIQLSATLLRTFLSVFKHEGRANEWVMYMTGNSLGNRIRHSATLLRKVRHAVKHRVLANKWMMYMTYTHILKLDRTADPDSFVKPLNLLKLSKTF